MIYDDINNENGRSSGIVFVDRRCPSLRTPANLLVFNLAISDILIMSKMPIFIINSLYFGPVFGKIGCRIYGFIGGLSGTSAICTLAAISVDRYYVIKNPLSKGSARLRAKISIAITWCYSALFSGIPLLDLESGSYVPEGYLTSCSFDYLSRQGTVKIFILSFFVAAWVVPFILITYCYVNILKTVVQTRNMSKPESSRHIKEEAKRRQEFKLALTVLFIIALWFVAWTPYAIVALLGIANRDDLITPLASMIPALFCKTASCVDPFLYALTNPKFKREVQKRFASKMRHSTRVWSTQISARSMNHSRRKLSRIHSCHLSDDVDEEVITVTTAAKNATHCISETPRPSVQIEMCADRPQWWYRPNFKNRDSSIRDAARRWTMRRRSQKDNECEYCTESRKRASV